MPSSATTVRRWRRVSRATILAAVAAVSTGIAALPAAPTAAAATMRARSTPETAVPLGDRVAYGAFEATSNGLEAPLSVLESQLGAHLGIASSYQGAGDVFPDAMERQDAASGHTLLVSWDLGVDRSTDLRSWADGSHDAYLTQVADAVKAFARPIYLRPWPEMNGDWSPFQPTAAGTAPAGGTPTEFVAAWRHLVTLFRQRGATNARWVFDPDSATYAGTTPVASIWPGAAYVEVLGIDGYNWGGGGVFQWQSFATVMGQQYSRLVALDPTAPVWICEFGSKEPAEADGAPIDPTHSKAVWYSRLLSDTGFRNITALVFFNTAKERDWRVGSDPRTLSVVSSWVRQAHTTVETLDRQLRAPALRLAPSRQRLASVLR